MDHTPIVKIKDYERIHGIANAILVGQESKPHKSCLFFSMAGAYILTTKLKIEARPVAGAAFFCVSAGEKNDVLSFAKIEKNDGRMTVDSNEDSFHCWVEAGDWVIDFMAPLFNMAAKEAGFTSTVPMRMFQKKKSQMSETPNLERIGDYFLVPNQELTNNLLVKNLSRNDVKDLLDISRTWFKSSEKGMQSEMTIGSSDGEITRMHINPISLNGKW